MANHIKTVVIFDAISDALEFESIAKQAKFPGRLLPTPHVFSTGCELAWASGDEYYININKKLKTFPQLDVQIFRYDTLQGKIIT